MKLEVICGSRKELHEVPPCTELFRVLREKYALRLDCGGNGRCGKCGIILEHGLAEYQGRVVSGKGQTLPACQLLLLSDASVRLPNGTKQEEEADTDAIITADTGTAAYEQGIAAEYGIAVDIGTTNLKFALVRLSDGTVVKTYDCRNSQGSYGADVMSRITAACAGEAGRLTELVHSDIKKGIHALGFLPRIVSFACNTTMLSLLCGFPLDGMKEHPFTPYCLTVTQKEWKGIPAYFAPCAGAFIGGDIIAGLATVPWDDEVSLLIDLGTNGELVIGTKEHMLAVSVAAGPAFEGGDWRKGTSVLEALAEAYRSGVVDETGLLSEPYFETGYCFFAEDGSLAGTLTQGTVRELQMAKAAVRTGAEYLLAAYESRYGGQKAGHSLSKVYLAGGMGSITERACLELGMLPECCRGKTEFVGNTSLAGAVRMLADASAYEEMERLAERIEEHDLAEWEEFGVRYLEYLNLPARNKK